MSNMMIARVSTKGQVVLPQEVRAALGIMPGDTLQIEQVGALILLKRIPLSSLRAELRQSK